MDETKPQLVKVGDGLTLRSGSDAYPGTVIRVSPSGKTIWFQLDNAKRIDNNGLSESQEYEFERNILSDVHKAIWKKGSWKCGVCRVNVGHRHCYRDPSF